MKQKKRNFPLIMITEIITRHKGPENKFARCEGFTMLLSSYSGNVVLQIVLCE